MNKGDLALIYHTGDERQAVGIAEIVSKPYADPNEDNEKLVVVDLKPKKPLARPVTLSDIKGDKTFAGWEGDTNKTFRIQDGAIVGGTMNAR